MTLLSLIIGGELFGALPLLLLEVFMQDLIILDVLERDLDGLLVMDP